MGNQNISIKCANQSETMKVLDVLEYMNYIWLQGQKPTEFLPDVPGEVTINFDQERKRIFFTQGVELARGDVISGSHFLEQYDVRPGDTLTLKGELTLKKFKEYGGIGDMLDILDEQDTFEVKTVFIGSSGIPEYVKLQDTDYLWYIEFFDVDKSGNRVRENKDLKGSRITGPELGELAVPKIEANDRYGVSNPEHAWVGIVTEVRDNGKSFDAKTIECSDSDVVDVTLRHLDTSCFRFFELADAED